MKFDKEINDRAIAYIIATTMSDTHQLHLVQLNTLLQALNLNGKQQAILYRELKKLNLPNAQTGVIM